MAQSLSRSCSTWSSARRTGWRLFLRTSPGTSTPTLLGRVAPWGARRTGWRNRRPRASRLYVAPDADREQAAGGDQEDVIGVVQASRSSLRGVLVAGRLWRLLSGRIAVGRSDPVHRHPKGASPHASFPRRAPRSSAQVSGRVRRAISLGLTAPNVAPLQGSTRTLP